MRLWLGIGERLGPFWAGVTLLSTRRQQDFEDYDYSVPGTDVNARALTCAAIFVFVMIAVATTLFVAFLVLLLSY